MQKAISTFVLSLSVFLLFLTMADAFARYLSAYPPFCPPVQAAENKEQLYTGSDFAIKSSGKEPSSLNSRAYCLMDADSGRVLTGKAANKKMPMASTTKIMTCIIALENGDLDSEVKVSAYAASMPDVQLNMVSGDSFYLRDLLYSLMLESHNDTAVAIAEHIGGTVEGFAELMNRKAAELGCTKTHFVTPNGLDDAEHYTTARELCMIAAYAIKNKRFLKIIQTPSRQFSNCQENRSYSVTNHDAFLSMYPGAIGIKTGFTGNAGYCFCGAAKRNGKTLISSVLACGWPPHKTYKWGDTRKLMDYGFANFEKVTVQCQKLADTLPVTGGTKSSVTIRRTTEEAEKLMLKADDALSIRYSLPKRLTAPVRQGDIIGYEEYYLNNELLYQCPIITTGSVEARTIEYYQKLILDLFFLRI